MSDITKILLSFVGGAFLFSWLLCSMAQPAVASDYISNFKRIPLVENRPPQVGTWQLTPTVIVCEYAPVSEAQIKSAVNFWKGLGYNFFSTQYKNDPLHKCLSDNPTGYIIIHLITREVKLEETALAQTQFYINNDSNRVEWAVIHMKSDIRETVLEHELGHALGFLHYNKINHLMNENWTMGGWDKEGLVNKR